MMPSNIWYAGLFARFAFAQSCAIAALTVSVITLTACGSGGTAM